jgi:cytochrome P450
MVFVTDPKAGREAALGDIERVHAGEANGILYPLVGESVITMDGPEMLERKRLVIEPLHNPDFLAFAAATVAEVTREAVGRWPRGQVLALRPRMQEITLDVIIRLVFGAESQQEAADLRGRLLHLLDVCDPPFFLMFFWPEQYTGSGLFSRRPAPPPPRRLRPSVLPDVLLARAVHRQRPLLQVGRSGGALAGADW